MNNTTRNIQKLRKNSLMRVLHAFAKTHEVQLYLVGGSVRDLLLNRPTTDWDFTLESDAIQFAKLFARSIRSPFVPLEKQLPTARVIIKTRRLAPTELDIDFAQFRAATLTDDLLLRDLTINAMAIPLDSAMESDNPEVIDPCNGRNDLATRQLQFPSEQVILNDPLRLMRIYRFAAQLDFEIPQKSIGLIQKHKRLLPEVSIERIRDEFLKILNVEKATPYLRQILEIGLFTPLFRNIIQTNTLWQPLENFEDNPIPETLSSYEDEIRTYLSEELGLYANRRSLIKLCLLRQGNIIRIGELLRFSKKARQFLQCLVAGHRRLSDKDLTKKQIIDFLRDSESDWWGSLLCSAAVEPIPPEVLRKIVDTYYGHLLPILKQEPLITGKDIIKKFRIKKGKKIGVLLEQIEEQQFYGEIKTRDEALAMVEALIRQGGNSYKSG